jgi:single-strand DNA-binding protein
MASYTATGILHEIFETQQVSEKFSKREFVLEIQEGQYPEHIKFQLVQQKTDLIDPYQIGQQVTVDFNLRGKGFNKNGQMTYFTNLDVWKIQPVGQAAAQPQQRTAAPAQGQRQAAKPATTPAPIVSDDDNDLPF